MSVDNLTVANVLMGGITAVTGVVCYVSKLLWQRSEQCEKDRYELRAKVEKLEADYGVATGMLNMIARCPVEKCPFRNSK